MYQAQRKSQVASESIKRHLVLDGIAVTENCVAMIAALLPGGPWIFDGAPIPCRSMKEGGSADVLDITPGIAISMFYRRFS